MSQTLRSNGKLLADDINRDFGIPWFMRYDYRDDPRYLALADTFKAQADQFMRDGFIIFHGEINAKYADDTVEEFRIFCDRNKDYFDPFRDDYGHLQRIINLHLAISRFVDLFSQAKNVLALQDALFSAPTSIYTSLYFERGSSQPIHRDTPYFTTRPEYTYFGTWFALEDANPDNGCLEVIPGGHLVKEIDRKAFVRKTIGDSEVGSINTELFDQYQNEVVATCQSEGLKSVLVPMKKGDVLIWHPQLPHGGGHIANRTLTRNSIVMHTVPEGCPVYHADAFFNPSNTLPGDASWPMKQLFGRAFAGHDTVEVMHQSPRAPHTFV